jgi:phosphate transport system permease protein
VSRESNRRLVNTVFTVACLFATTIAVIALASLFFSLFWNGLHGLSLSTFTRDSQEGGLLNGILGSIAMCAFGMVFALVIGILAGTWLAEYAGASKLGQYVRFMNDVLLSAPSILIGLAVYTYFYMVLKAAGYPQYTYSGIAGATALALLATPIVVRTTEDMLNLQPGALREAGVALGASRGLVIRKVIWRAARTGLLTGGLLGFARISGETAPLLFTALGNDAHISKLADLGDKMSALPLLINSLYQLPDTAALAWTAALLISLAVLIVNIIGRYLARGARQS